jgi:O-antigen ligase
MIEKILVILIILLPLQFALNVGENIDLVITRLLVPVVFFLWLARGLARKKIWIADRTQTWLIFAFLFLALISLWGGLDWVKGTRKILYLFSIVPIYFVAADLAQDEKLRIKIVKVIWASGVLAAMTGLVQFALPFVLGLEATLRMWKKLAVFFLGNSFGKLVVTNPSWLVNISGVTRMRAFGTFADPHIFSFFVSLCFFTALGLLIHEKSRFLKAAYFAGDLLMILAIGFSFSRGAYLGVAAGALVFLIVYLAHSGHLKKVLLAGGAAALILLLFFLSPVFQRMTSVFNLKEGSNVERMKNWSQATEIISDYPLFGIGLGNYSSVIDPTASERSSIYAHNLFLDIAAETGILNGLVFVGLILVSIWKNIRGKDMIGLGLAAGFVYFLVHGIFDTPIWAPQVMVVFLVILALNLNVTRLRVDKKLHN